MVLIHHLFNDYKKIRLRGYSNDNSDYKKAKEAIDRGWPSLTEGEIEQCLTKCHWIGGVVPDGYIVIDIDNRTSGEVVLEGLINAGYSFNAIKTPNGYQFIFKDTAKVKNQGAKRLTLGGVSVDYRLSGKGYIVLPTHNTEGRKVVQTSEIDLDPMPLFFIPVRGFKETDEELGKIHEGSRNTTLHSHACKIRAWNVARKLNLSFDEKLQVLNEINHIFCYPPLDQNEIERIVNSSESSQIISTTLSTVNLSETVHINNWPDPPAPEAFHGLAGEFVKTIEPHTEADPVALLIQFLVMVGNIIGKSAHFVAEADFHYSNLFSVLVGLTSKGRKGSSWGRIKTMFGDIDGDWGTTCVQSGLSSGEGLIWAIRDPIYKHEAVRENGKPTGEVRGVEIDHGVEDKRLLVFEPEFASALRVINRDGNTLSAIIRQAWDVGDLKTLTKNSPAKATGGHISIIGHITRDELRRYLDRTESGNGFANRFLWVCVKRSKTLPEGGNLQESDLAPLIDRLSEAIKFARTAGEIKRDDAAREMWREVYPELSEGKPGLLGAIISRAEAQVMRLACLYALLDFSRFVRPEHLKAALALWEYCEASCQYTFGDSLGDPVADEILRELRKSPEGLTGTDISNLFGRNKNANQLSRALSLLMDNGLVRRGSKETKEGGRPAVLWTAI